MVAGCTREGGGSACGVCTAVGEVATPDEIEAVFGVRELPPNGVTEDLLMNFNAPDNREVGVPGGGGFGRARDLALFFLHKVQQCQ